MISRRHLFGVVPILVLATASAARADFISAPDVVVYCDPGLAEPLRHVGADFRARTGVPVRVLTAPGTLLLELLARGTRNDVIVTLAAVLDDAAARNLLRPGSRAGAWRNPVVLAGRDAVAGTGPVDTARLRSLLGDGRLAVVDPVAADRIDGPAIVRQLGWQDVAADRMDGMASGQDVAFSVATGADRLGLLHRADLAGHRNLREVATAATPPAEISAAIGKNALSRHSTAFLAYLVGDEAGSRLRSDGLEAIR